MEISNVVRHPYFFLLPIGFVIVCVVLVFAFGFRSSVEPNFSGLSGRHLEDDKRPKKKRSKEKKYSGLNLLAPSSDESVEKAESESNLVREAGVSKRHEEMRNKKPSNEIVDKSKGKKTARETDERLIDDGEGEWETAFSRKDKKNKKKENEKGAPAPKKKKEPSKDVKKEPSKDGKKEASKDGKKEPSKDGKKEPSKDGKKEPSKESKKELSKEASKESKKEPSKEVSKEGKKELSKDGKKENHKSSDMTLGGDSSSSSLFAVSSKEKLGRSNFSSHTLSGKKKKKGKKEFF